MTDIEKLITKIGELVATEIKEVKAVNYSGDKDLEITAFTMTLKNGLQYSVNFKELQN